MGKQLRRYVLGNILALAFFTVTLVVLFSSFGYAHSPILLIEDNEDGTILVMAGFSTGKMAVSKQIQLKSRTTAEVLWEGTLDQNGELTCPKQTEPYSVFFDGGPGHSIEKAGPLPQEGETVPEQMSHAGRAGHDATTGATSGHSGEAILPIPPDNYLPLSPDFDEQVKTFVSVRDLRRHKDLSLDRRKLLHAARANSDQGI